jgi:hypothetical protein
MKKILVPVVVIVASLCAVLLPHKPLKVRATQSCYFSVSTGMTGNGWQSAWSPRGSILCVNGLNHDPNGELARGLTYWMTPYCNGDSLILNGPFMMSTNFVFGAVFGSGCDTNSNRAAYQELVIPAGNCSATFVLYGSCSNCVPTVSATQVSGGTDCYDPPQ